MEILDAINDQNDYTVLLSQNFFSSPTLPYIDPEIATSGCAKRRIIGVKALIILK